MAKASQISKNKQVSVRKMFQGCSKKKKRRKDSNNLGQQVVQTKHSVDNMKCYEKATKQDKEKLYPKLLVNPFIGLFKNATQGNEVNRANQFFSTSDRDRARFNGYKFLRRDDKSVTEKVLNLSSLKIHKPGMSLSFSKKLENAHEEERSKSRHLCVNNQEKFESETVEKSRIQFVPKLLIKTDVEGHIYKNDKVIIMSEGNDRLINSLESSKMLLQEERLPIENCRRFCKNVSSETFTNYIMVAERDPLQRTKLSLQRIFSDSHRQHLLRRKVGFVGFKFLDETQVFANQLEESQNEVLNERNIRVSQLETVSSYYKKKILDFNRDNRHTKEVESSSSKRKIFINENESCATLSNRISNNADSLESNIKPENDLKCFYNDFLKRNVNLLSTEEKPEAFNLNFHIHKNNHTNNEESIKIFSDTLYCIRKLGPDCTTNKGILKFFFQNSAVNSNRVETNIENLQKSPGANLISQIPLNGVPMISENLSQQSKTRKIIKPSDKQLSLMKPKLKFVAVKKKEKFQITSHVALSKLEKAAGKLLSSARNVSIFQPKTSFDTSHYFTSRMINDQLESRKKLSHHHKQSQNNHNVTLMHLEPKQYSETSQYENQVEIYKINPAEGNFRTVKSGQVDENPHRPYRLFPFFSSNVQNLNTSRNRGQSHIFSLSKFQNFHPNKAANMSKRIFDSNTINGFESCELMTTLNGQNDLHTDEKYICRVFSPNLQKQNMSQPIKFAALGDHQIQKRVPIYFYKANKSQITHFPSSNINKKNTSIQSQF